MNWGMVLAVIIAPVICGLAATLIIGKVQAALARKKESSEIRTRRDWHL